MIIAWHVLTLLTSPQPSLHNLHTFRSSEHAQTQTIHGIWSYLQEVWDRHDDSETYLKIRTCLLYDGATTQLRTIYFDNVLKPGTS